MRRDPRDIERINPDDTSNNTNTNTPPTQSEEKSSESVSGAVVQKSGEAEEKQKRPGAPHSAVKEPPRKGGSNAA